jgi:hypothetical protein
VDIHSGIIRVIIKIVQTIALTTNVQENVIATQGMDIMEIIPLAMLQYLTVQAKVRIFVLLAIVDINLKTMYVMRQSLIVRCKMGIYARNVMPDLVSMGGMVKLVM